MTSSCSITCMSTDNRDVGCVVTVTQTVLISIAWNIRCKYWSTANAKSSVWNSLSTYTLNKSSSNGSHIFICNCLLTTTFSDCLLTTTFKLAIIWHIHVYVYMYMYGTCIADIGVCSNSYIQVHTPIESSTLASSYCIYIVPVHVTNSTPCVVIAYFHTSYCKVFASN